ncbi:MAG: response regulator [Magnetococcales bacterium]|nr:response regulator [Magnetococcales bacterium]
MRTLIVDDEFNNRILLGKLLDRLSECDLVSNGREAVEAFENAIDEGHPYDLVLLDIMMPELDGQAALERIRRVEEKNGLTGREASVIFMVSALDTEEHVVRAFFRGGCSDYLAKPVTQEGLFGKLKEYGFLTEPSSS